MTKDRASAMAYLTDDLPSYRLFCTRFYKARLRKTLHQYCYRAQDLLRQEWDLEEARAGLARCGRSVVSDASSKVKIIFYEIMVSFSISVAICWVKNAYVDHHTTTTNLRHRANSTQQSFNTAKHKPKNLQLDMAHQPTLTPQNKK